MIITFREFIKGTCCVANLYIVRSNAECLYVGISARDVWERWFGSRTPHMLKNAGGHWRGDYSSTIGAMIIRAMPASLEWTIELRQVDFSPGDALLRETERQLIRDLKPKCNVLYND